MKRLTLITLAVAALSLSACGGDDDDKSSSSSAGDQQADSKAKSTARTAVSSMEVCFAEQQTYVDCPVEAGATASADETSYEIVAKSKSGAKFTIAKDAEGTSRTCEPAGEGGCKAGGKW
jgi:type IV pilus assembly protein PilA